MTRALRMGVVLTGGGARAAYHAGVVRALAALPVEIAAVSAVGAGALNGAVLASAPLNIASQTLERLWMQTVLAEEAALRLGPLPILRLGAYLTFLFGSGTKPAIEERIKRGASNLHAIKTSRRLQSPSGGGDDIINALAAVAYFFNVTTDAKLGDYLSQSFRAAAANPIVPFYVSVYESNDGILSALKQGLQLIGMVDAGFPTYVDIYDRSLTPEDRIAAVLASASLPFVCEAGRVGGHTYVDGSFAGMKHSPGAVPLLPLRCRKDLSLDAVLVVHTESGIAWDSTQFRDVQIIEIRPSIPSELLGIGYFWPKKELLVDWMATGERDTLKKLTDVFSVLRGWETAATNRAQLLSDASHLD